MVTGAESEENPDAVSELAVREAILSAMYASIRWDKMNRVEWAETVRRMEDGGRFGFDYAPYQREPFEEIENPDVNTLVMALFSRGGKTEIVCNHIGYNIEQDPRRMIVAYPTDSQAEDFSKDNLEKQLLGPTPTLSRILPSGAGRRLASNTIHSKSFPGGKIDIVGLNVAGKLRKLKANWIYADEIDAIKDDASDEGDKIAILFRRGSEFPDTRQILTSYPSIAGKSRIWAWLEKSDFRKWFVAHSCGHQFVMHRNQMRWEPGKPETAVLVCPGCGKEYDDAERIKIARAGEWRPTREFTGIRGYQANGMLWPHPYQSSFRSFLHQLATECENVGKAESPERAKRVLVNTFDAEPYEEPLEQKSDPVTILARREDYDPNNELPEGVLVLTAGADVNKGFIAVEIVGHGMDGQTWGIHYEEIHGPAIRESTWSKFDKLLLRRWKHPKYGEMGIRSCCVDSKYQSQIVKPWCGARANRGIVAIVGSTRLGSPILAAKRKDPKTGVVFWSIGTHEAKDLIYQRLELFPDEDGEVPAGYMHYPISGNYDAPYFQGLLVEDAKLKRADDGKYYRWFEKVDQSVRNEPLDCRVYAMAACMLINPVWDRLKANLDARAKEAPAKKKAPEPAERRRRFIEGFR